MPQPINLALIRIVRRAEQSENDILVNTFVDTGMLGEVLSSPDHQIVYGRRGTGKTHALTYLSNKIRNAGNLALYIDLRTIGSNGSIYSDESLPVSERVSRLLVDVGNEVHYKIQEVILEGDLLESDQNFTKSVQYLDQLASALTTIKVEGEVETSAESEDNYSQAASSSLKATLQAAPSLGLETSDTSSSTSKSASKVSRKGKATLNVQFGSISHPIEALLALLNKRLYILLDEWSVIPEDLQPYLADMIKRSFLTVSRISVKIAAIEQRSNFRHQTQSQSYIGFELGADVSADVDLDDYMVFDNDATRASDFFKDLFYKHITSDKENNINLHNSNELVRQGFTQSNAFDELVRAAEGVPRDAINIISLAAQAANADAISIPHIRSAARRWYQRDKEQTLSANSNADQLLRHIVDEVIGKRKARAFLVPQNKAKTDSLLNFLYDSRVLHVLKRSVSSNDRPGDRFSVFKIDYGCYVELLNTQNAPKGLFDVSESEVENYVEVPQDDYRSIRRAILNVDDFEK